MCCEAALGRRFFIKFSDFSIYQAFSVSSAVDSSLGFTSLLLSSSSGTCLPEHWDNVPLDSNPFRRTILRRVSPDAKDAFMPEINFCFGKIFSLVRFTTDSIALFCASDKYTLYDLLDLFIISCVEYHNDFFTCYQFSFLLSRLLDATLASAELSGLTISFRSLDELISTGCYEMCVFSLRNFRFVYIPFRDLFMRLTNSRKLLFRKL